MFSKYTEISSNTLCIPIIYFASEIIIIFHPYGIHNARPYTVANYFRNNFFSCAWFIEVLLATITITNKWFLCRCFKNSTRTNHFEPILYNFQHIMHTEFIYRSKARGIIGDMNTSLLKPGPFAYKIYYKAS